MNEPLPLHAGGRTIPDAVDRVRRYAGLPWSGGPPEVWAFAYYDAVPTEHDTAITPVDVLCTAALHPGLSRADLTFFVRHAADLTSWLSAIPADQTLWDADDALLGHLDDLCRFEPDVTMTLLTKVLHRKRPRLVPLLDRHVIDFYRPPGGNRRASSAWPWVIRHMLNDLETPEQRLQVAVSVPTTQVHGSNHVDISLLRFIDIAIWMDGR